MSSRLNVATTAPAFCPYILLGLNPADTTRGWISSHVLFHSLRSLTGIPGRVGDFLNMPGLPSHFDEFPGTPELACAIDIYVTDLAAGRAPRRVGRSWEQHMSLTPAATP
jgi:hypothetical protein